ncbi:up-regulator of cell proliferation-like [Solea solea]|uniref:up-regulator of cell proliferation-like n=1 Tax=Solea solea TaxID=90069 RepID=UPI00272D0C65|nr:up-regulator of cell proliferation-like [Solea solea]
MYEDKHQTTSTMDTSAALMTFLSKVGLENSYPNKLTRQLLLEINRNSIYDEPGESVKTLPWRFLRQLYGVNAKCRNCRHVSSASDDDFLQLDDYSADDSAECNAVNPLDLILALFLCADSFLQQEMALKMSMCQFSLPLLLPHGNNSQRTLMLWALRDIVKEWCPHDLSQSKGFVEENIVQANIPLFSFVRLKNCSWSKSQLLNHVLSRGQQKCNIFTHREMEGGAVKREIANGLVEVCWYLPCGSESLDIFPNPATFTNLRGEICESLKEFRFLFQVSTVIFVCLDRVDEDELRILTSLQDVKSKLFLVVNRNGENKREDMMSVKKLVEELNLPNNRVRIKDPKLNVTEFSKKLCDAIKTLLLDVNTTVSIANMFDKAVELDISVDECKGNKQKEAAQQLVKEIGNQPIPVYKKQHLPLQIDKWKRLSQLEMDKWGLKENMSQLLEEEKNIRKVQNEHTTSTHMVMFSEQLSKCSREKRDFFLKWLRLELNAHSRTKLSELRNQFKEQCKNKDVKLIAELDQALVDSSLGIEHYMREMGLIYEFSTDSISSPIAADEIAHLPALAAEMLLDGYPLELLDGDASNIPERWVTDVLMELHKKVGQKSRLLVLTVLGVQSSGKSTLLNTMFGVQFPVSSGRCTRGAFMLFLKVGEDLKSELHCDFIVVIDTEGLKSPDLAQLEDSYEHDNQLATFVIGLSDVTIINIAMENATAMKDVLQIAIYTLLRLNKREKKTVCHFVHQNVSGVSAHAKIMTERKHLLDQLNEMTQIAAEMERQHSVKQFADVLNYDIEKNNWNIPGLWHGTPPMAPVNTGYSEAVAHFKKHLFQMVMSDKCNEFPEIPEFLVWMRSLWKAVKCENVMFSFRNTLVAHAFNNLFKEYTQWEWEFRKEILSWQTETQSEILNVHYQSDTHTWIMLVESKKSEASEKVEAEEKKMKESLNNYYRRKEKQVHLIENFIKDIFQSISNIADEIRHSLNTTLDFCFTLKKQVQEIYSRLPIDIENRKKSLLKDVQHCTLSDKQLTEMFEEMWAGVTHQHVHDIESLQTFGKVSFEDKSDHQTDSKNDDLQILAETITESCTKFVLDQAKLNTHSDDEFTVELLAKIDQAFQENGKGWQNKFEINLKLHICGIAAREFLKMQENSLQFD